MRYLSKIYFESNNSGDRITIGLIIHDGKTTIKLLDSKIRKVRALVSRETYTFFKHIARQVEQVGNEEGLTLQEIRWMHANYNGLIRVSKPSGISIELKEEEIEKLLKKLCQ